MLMIDNLNLLPLCFHSQDNYSLRGRKGYRCSLKMIDLTAIILIQIFVKIWKRTNMTSRLIRLGLSDHPSTPVRAKVECCKSHDLFSCWVMDCSATRIPSSSITGHHPWSMGSLTVVGFTPQPRCSWRIFTAPAEKAICSLEGGFFLASS